MRPRDDAERQRTPIWLIGLCFYALLGAALIGAGMTRGIVPLIVMGVACVGAAGWMTWMDMRRD